MKPDYYEVLNVRSDATSDEIRAAWRSLARTHHPDRVRGEVDAARWSMALLNEAWATLGNASLREAYDLSRYAPEPPPVQDAVLAAARLELSCKGWTITRDSDSDALFVRQRIRVAVRYARTLNASGLGDWLPFAGVLSGSVRIDCAVLLACRVLVPDEVALRVAAAAFPAVAIDLTEATAFGEFPCTVSRELFRTFLIEK